MAAQKKLKTKNLIMLFQELQFRGDEIDRQRVAIECVSGGVGVAAGRAGGPAVLTERGGDLAAEIRESGTRPRVIEIAELFPEDFFKEKYLLFVTR